MKRLLLSVLCSLLAALPAFAILDTNNNGLSDLWEKQHNSGALFPSSIDPQDDTDQDGWTNAQEAESGTNPFMPNPPDGMVRPSAVHIAAEWSDPDEYGEQQLITPGAITVAWPTLAGKQYTLNFSPDLTQGGWLPVGSPFLANGGVSEYGFYNISGTEKLFWRVVVEDADSDNDGLTNHEEYLVGSNPNLTDTDGDSMPDAWEVQHSLDPNDAGDANADPDQDGLNNSEEAELQTDPNNSDSDGDRILDGQDAVPTDGEINWERTPEFTYVWIPQVSKTGATAVSKHGHILFPGSNDGVNDIKTSEILWDSKTSDWVNMPMNSLWQNSGLLEEHIELVEVADGPDYHQYSYTPATIDWSYDTINSMNDAGVLLGKSTSWSNALMRWEMTGASNEYGSPTYHLASTEYQPVEDTESAKGKKHLKAGIANGDHTWGQDPIIADDGTISDIAWGGDDWSAWVVATPQSGQHSSNMTSWHTMPIKAASLYTPENVAVMLDGQTGMLYDRFAGEESSDVVRYRDAQGIEILEVGEQMATPLDIGRTHAPPGESIGRIWFSAYHDGGNAAFIEKSAGGSGASRWHKPGSMANGAIRLNARGEAITTDNLWRNGTYTPINDLVGKPDGSDLNITKLIDLASNGIILAEATEGGTTRTGLLVPVEVGLVELTEDGGMVAQVDPVIEMNTSAPQFDLSNVNVGSVTENDGEFQAELSLSGSVQSKSCDAVPGELGTISSVTIAAEGISYETDEIELNTTVTKDSLGGSNPYAYPFTGDFNLPSTGINITEGTNTVTVSAVDPASGELGQATLAFDVTLAGGESGIPVMSSAGIDIEVLAMDVTTVDSATMSYQVSGESTPTTINLVETGADTQVFESSDGNVSLSVDATSAKVVSYLSITDWSLSDLYIPLVQNGSSYSGSIVTISVTQTGTNNSGTSQVIISQPRVVAESGPGEARVYGIRLQGFDYLDDDDIKKITFNHKDFPETELNLFRHQSTGAVFVEDPNRANQPLVALPRAAETSSDDDPDSTSHSERLAGWVAGSPEAAQFAAGVLYGFGQGGVDLVVGLGKLWVNSVTYAGDELALAAAVFELGLAELNPFATSSYKQRLHLQIKLAHDDLAQRSQNIADLAQAAADLVKWINEAEDDLLVSVFLRPFDAQASTQANHRLGEKNQQIIEIASMLIDSVVDTWSNASAADKGRYTGIILFEVASSFIAVAKVEKVTKAKWLTKLASRNIDIPGGSLLKAKATGLATEFATTKMCFVAGTMVAGASLEDDLVHFMPIEQISQSSLVWARDETTGKVAKRRVLECFETHPDHLHHVSIDTDGDGQADETLTGTSEHPFWSPTTNEWVRMGDLKAGTSLLLLDHGSSTSAQTSAYVLENQRQNAPPGETFKTYNFEVEDFHTYFVGEAGIWVHNTGKQPCEKIFSVFFQKAKELGGTATLREKRFDLIKGTKAVLRPDKGIHDASWRHSSVDVSSKMIDDFATGQIESVADLPSVTKWNAEFFGPSGTAGAIPKGRGLDDAVEVHHSVEKWIQGKLGIAQSDDVPGAVLLKRTGQPDGHAALQGRLRSEIIGLTESDDIVAALRGVYQERPEWSNLWPTAESWLQGKGISIPN